MFVSEPATELLKDCASPAVEGDIVVVRGSTEENKFVANIIRALMSL